MVGREISSFVWNAGQDRACKRGSTQRAVELRKSRVEPSYESGPLIFTPRSLRLCGEMDFVVKEALRCCS
jgi:hypothetical protein